MTAATAIPKPTLDAAWRRLADCYERDDAAGCVGAASDLERILGQLGQPAAAVLRELADMRAKAEAVVHLQARASSGGRPS